MKDAAREAAVQGRVAVPGAGEVSTLRLGPERPRALYVLAHGAGAGMRHAFMEQVAVKLAEHGIATLRYQFPYVERRSRRIDSLPVLLATVRAAVAAGRETAGGAPVIAGGKSMGGRMTSQASAEAPLAGVAGLAFLGFPLHPAGQPGVARAGHLAEVRTPMLFLQGTRDALADLTLLEPIVAGLGPHATLRRIEHADHGFHVLKRSGRTDGEALDELATLLSRWVESLA